MVALLVEPDLAPARAGTAGTRNDRGDGVLAQIVSQPFGIIALVGDQATDAAGCFGQHIRSGPFVAGIARCQKEDRQAAHDVDERVNLGGLAAARGTDALRLGPFPPWTERCALT